MLLLFLSAEIAFHLRWQWTRAQSRLYLAFEVSDSEEDEGSHGNKVVQTEENDDGEELQSNSDQDNNEALKNRHQRQHKKMEGERCSDKNKDANGSEGEGESKGESEEEESEDESISKGETSDGKRKKKRCPLPQYGSSSSKVSQRSTQLVQSVCKNSRI